MAEEAPRWLTREALGQYVGVRVDYVARLVKAGKLPAPSYHFGPKTPRWDRLAVDALFEGHSSFIGESADAAVQRVVDAIGRGEIWEPRRKR